MSKSNRVYEFVARKNLQVAEDIRIAKGQRFKATVTPFVAENEHGYVEMFNMTFPDNDVLVSSAIPCEYVKFAGDEVEVKD